MSIDSSILFKSDASYPTTESRYNSATLIKKNSPMRENLARIRNAGQSERQYTALEERSGKIIKSFMIKVIPAQSYGKMFANGARFDFLQQKFPQYEVKAPLSALDHLNRISKNYLQTIKEKIGKLSDEERGLLRQVINAKMTLRHQSNSDLVKDEKLNIFSQAKIIRNKVSTSNHTFKLDKIHLSNHDFVFFGMEFSDDKTQFPLNTQHSMMDYGANAYLVDANYPYGYMTLTDHFYNTMPPTCKVEHLDFAEQFPKARVEAFREVHNDKNEFDVPIYTSKDMRLGLGLHLIDFIRNSEDNNFKRFALSGNLDAKNLDRLIHFVFQPEFHVPRQVSTSDYQYVKLRDIPLKDAIFASNIERIDELVITRDTACQAVEIAIGKQKKDVVYHLFDKFQFQLADVPKMQTTYMDLSYALTDHSAHIDILHLFLDKKLIDVNKPFNSPNRGSSMLDNALRYDKKSMAELLIKYGALTGEAIKEKEKLEKKTSKPVNQHPRTRAS